MSKKQEMDFSRANLDATMKEYEPLLCDHCKEYLRVAGEPIRERLNNGKNVKLRHIKKLLGSVCTNCAIRINSQRLNSRKKAGF